MSIIGLCHCEDCFLTFPHTFDDKVESLCPSLLLKDSVYIHTTHFTPLLIWIMMMECCILMALPIHYVWTGIVHQWEPPLNLAGSQNHDLHEHCCHIIFFITQDLVRALRNTRESSSPGPYRLSGHVLRHCAHQLGDVFSILFQSSMHGWSPSAVKELHSYDHSQQQQKRQNSE